MVVAAADVVVKNGEIRGRGPLVEEEVRVVDERVVHPRRRRPAEHRPALVLVPTRLVKIPFYLLQTNDGFR